jgi:hypothetical protein
MLSLQYILKNIRHLFRRLCLFIGSMHFGTVNSKCTNLSVLCHVIDDKSKSNIKGKAVPLQACSGPQGSRKLSFPDFVTTAHDGGRVVSLTHRPPLPQGNIPGTHFC